MTSHPHPIAAAIPEALRQARRHAGLSQSQLSARIGHGESRQISVLERGRQLPNTDTLCKYAAGLGIPAWKILRQAERIAKRVATAQRINTPGKVA